MSIWNFNKIRHNLCKVILPKDSKIIKKEEVTINELMDDHIQKLEQLPGIFSKDFLEKLIKEYPQMDHPNIIESDGELKFEDGKGHIVQLNIPLLTIVPIPYISKDDVDLDKYVKENFGNVKMPKNIVEIQGVKVEVPALNIVPIPEIPIKEIDKKESKTPKVKKLYNKKKKINKNNIEG